MVFLIISSKGATPEKKFFNTNLMRGDNAKFWCELPLLIKHSYSLSLSVERCSKLIVHCLAISVSQTDLPSKNPKTKQMMFESNMWVESQHKYFISFGHKFYMCIGKIISSIWNELEFQTINSIENLCVQFLSFL